MHLPAKVEFALHARRLVGTPVNGRSAFEMWRTVGVPRGEFFTRAKDAFGLGAGDTVIETASKARKKGIVRSAHQQRSNGIPIYGATYSLTERDGYVLGGSGQLITGLNNLPTTANIPEKTALVSAMNAIGATVYKWQANPSFPVPVGALVYYSKDMGATVPFKLAYSYQIGTVSPKRDSYQAFIDATSGAVLNYYSDISRVDYTAIGVDVWGNRLSFTADKVSSTQFRLQESGARRVLTWKSATFGSTNQDFTDTDGAFMDSSSQGGGVSAHTAGEEFVDYVATRLGAYSYGKVPGSEAKTVQAVSGSCGDGGPHFSPSDRMVYLCASPPNTGGPEIDRETVAHEHGHAIRAISSIHGSMNYTTPETAALSEGFADIFATSVEAFATGSNSDWLLFDECPSPSRRNIQDPKLSIPAQTDTYGYWPTPYDPHLYAGVLTKWFYLLAEGGSGTNSAGQSYTVAPVGRAVAEQIALDTYLDALTSNADFASAYVETMLTATAYFDTNVIESVNAAWAAVGLTFSDATNTWEAFPPPGATAIEPWPVAFQVNKPETCSKGFCAYVQGFQAELSDDNFEIAVPFELTMVGLPDGRIVAKTPSPSNLQAGKVYFWRLKAKVNDVWQSNWSFTGSFETSRKQPRGVKPAAGTGKKHPWPVEFSWERMLYASAGYEAQLIDPGGSPSSSNQETVPDVSYPSAVMYAKVNAPYTWKVTAKGPGGLEGQPSTKYHAANAQGVTAEDLERPWTEENALSFQTNGAPPTPLLPIEDQSPWDAHFEWFDNGAKSYRIVWSSDGWATNTPVDATHTTDGEEGGKPTRKYLMNNLPADATISWYVQGIGYFGDTGDASEIWTFHTTNPVPLITWPTADATAHPWPFTVEYTAVTGAIGYKAEVQQGSVVTPVTVALDGRPPVPTWAEAWLENDTSLPCQVRVQATGPAGQAGSWSAWVPFVSGAIHSDMSFPVVGDQVPGNAVQFMFNNDIAIFGPGSHDHYSGTRVAKHVVNIYYPYYETSAPLKTIETTYLPTSAGTDIVLTYLGTLPPGTYGWDFVATNIKGDEMRTGTASFEATTPPPKPKTCNSVVSSGGEDYEELEIDLVKTSGTFRWEYNTYVVPDYMELWYGSTLLRTTLLECVATNDFSSNGWLYDDIEYEGTTSKVTVKVFPHCDDAYDDDTIWSFKVGCPQ